MFNNRFVHKFVKNCENDNINDVYNAWYGQLMLHCLYTGHLFLQNCV